MQFPLPSLRAGHHGAGHLFELQLIAFLFEAAHHTIAAATPGEPIVAGRKHDMCLTLLIVRLDGLAL